MSNTLHKSEILRGYGTVSEVIRSGMRVSTPLLDCRIVARTVTESSALTAARPHLRVAFVVSKRKLKLATDRNRVKRLLREVFRRNRSPLQAVIGGRDLWIDIVILFSGTEDTSPRRLSYQSVEAEWKKASQQILGMIGRQ